METLIQILQPEGWVKPRGYSNGIVMRGRQVFIAGQIGWDAQGRFVSDDLAEQTRQALQNILTILAEAGGKPEHPYTELLLDSVPTVGKKWVSDRKLPEMELKEYQAAACKFAERCAYARDICRQTKPPNVEISPTRRALCYRPVDYEPGRTTIKREPHPNPSP
jgi:oligopeptide/dipeptide ABC transporter ATP-binding protein